MKKKRFQNKNVWRAYGRESKKGELRLIGKNLKGKIEVRERKERKIMFIYVRVVGVWRGLKEIFFFLRVHGSVS